MRDHLNPLVIQDTMQFSPSILLLDDCSGTFNYDVTSTPAGGSAAYDTSAACFGTNGILMQTDAGTPAEDDLIQIERNLPFPRTRFNTFFGRIAFEDASDVKDVVISLTHYDGTYKSQVSIKLDPQNGTVWYYDEDAAYQELTDLAFVYRDDSWFDVQYSFDNVAQQWISVFFNGFSADLEGIPAKVTLDTARRKTHLQIAASCNGAAQSTVYWDTLYVGDLTLI